MMPDNIKHRLKDAPTIMVVDDTEGVRKVISMQLRTLGYQVIEAKGGLQAVKLIKQEQPALVLMDINMPEVDGLDTARMIRQTDGINDIPIIGLSAHHGMEIRSRALEAGCQEFVTKPIEFRLLAAIINQYLKSD